MKSSGPNDIDLLFEEKRLIKPDYDNCIANLPNSIFKKFGLETVGNTLPVIDSRLEKDYKNIVVLLLDAMAHMEEVVSELAEGLEDTLFIITADHGHIDTGSVMFRDYPQLCECLERWPSLEPRALNFFVKEEKKEFFVSEFNRLFGDRFILMPMEDVIERKLMGTGTPHKEFRGMLGDYLAIATSDLSIYFTEERWLSMHGSLTEDEMLIPLIVFS